MKSVFPRNSSSMILSLPSHLVPMDKCYIMYMGSDDPIYPQRPTQLLGICSKEQCLNSETSRSETSSWYVFNHFQMYPFREFLICLEEQCIRMFPQRYWAFLQGFVELLALSALSLKWKGKQ